MSIWDDKKDTAHAGTSWYFSKEPHFISAAVARSEAIQHSICNHPTSENFRPRTRHYILLLVSNHYRPRTHL